MSSNSHFRELDGMRGVLAVVVMLHHMGLSSVLSAVTGGFLARGLWELSVDFFFILSGFVLCRSFLNSNARLGEYAIKRIARLAPLTTICTAGMLAIPSQNPWPPETISVNLAMIQPFVGAASINGPAWSVPFELFFPAVGVLLAAPVLGLGRTAVLASLAVATAASMLAAALLAHGFDQPWLRAASGLAAGGLLYLLRKSSPTGPASSGAASLPAFVGAIFIMALAATFPFAATAFPLLCVAAIWLGAGANGMLSLAPFQHLGRWSFAIYLTHMPILTGFVFAFGPETMDGAIALKALAIAVTLCVSAACHRFIEAPFIALGKRASHAAYSASRDKLQA